MKALKRHDRQKKILLVDINGEGFMESHPQIDVKRASEMLHGLRSNGHLLLGLDVSVHAWNLVGKKRWLRWLRRWPLRTPMDVAYRVFARYRYTFSLWLTGTSTCERCVVAPDSDKT
ncbi:DUF393 domain-containing protein [Aestuariirhabdus sp. Z084]|nr:DUF393 domain-containing protein [Aestuariirhabdus haliotis]MCL6419382.1 DUF393 domain-containing protein [Aestuariirhabdus haliotis]